MATITCPHCGKIIDIDPTSVEDLARQLRDELFAHDLEERLVEARHLHEAQVQAVREEERREADRRVAQEREEQAKLREAANDAAREAEKAWVRERAAAGEERMQLQAQLDDATRQTELSVERTRAEANEQIAQLKAQLSTQEQTLRAQAQTELLRVTGELERRTSELEAQLATQEQTLRAQAQTDLLRVTGELERRTSELEAQLKVEQARSEQAQAALREEMARREGELAHHSEEQLEAKDAQIAQYQAEVERLRDYRMRLSTKLVGESLERHCESEFNRIRMQAYPRATFEKDNVAVEGTKGDFIFRDYDEEGNELLSIMFEMKNEEEESSSANRKRNEDHFRKLDADRTKKGCEYAVLVSTLEPDNDFYNAGIADVSWHYPKMFVVRPQCFTTIIGLLKAAALAAHPYKLQLEQTRREELDVTRFEEKVGVIVNGIAHDYELASKNYDQAAKDIDAIIEKLKHLKGQLGTAAKHFGTASKRGDKLTVKRLTWGNQTMKEAFAQAAAQRDEELLADGAELREALDEPLEPDELE